MGSVAVTDLEYDKAREIFERAGSCVRAPTPESELAEMIRQGGGIHHVIVGVNAYQEALYDALPSGGVIARFGVGSDGIDKAQATEKGLLCTNTPGVLDDSVAEYAIALLLAAARHLPSLAEATRRGQWQPVLGHELKGKHLAVIGCGGIGRRVGFIAARGLAMHVVGLDPREAFLHELRRDYGFAETTTDYTRAVATADFVSLHLPGGPTTQHFMNAERLAAIPLRAWLINTARGSIIDERALYDALAGGRLAGAALDVFEQEPYAPVAADKDLRTLPSAILLPHAASSTQEACNRMAERALQNIAMAEAERFDQMDLLNPGVLAVLPA